MGTVEDLKKTSKFPQSQRGSHLPVEFEWGGVNFFTKSYGEWLDIV